MYMELLALLNSSLLELLISSSAQGAPTWTRNFGQLQHYQHTQELRRMLERNVGKGGKVCFACALSSGVEKTLCNIPFSERNCVGHMWSGRNGRFDRLSNSTNRLFHCWYCWKDLSPKTDATKYLGQKETRLCGLSMCPEPLPVSTILSNTELRAAYASYNFNAMLYTIFC